MPRLRSRKGFTIIMMALMFSVFVGVAAFATDFGRMYLIRGQLQAAADAGALAGVYRVANGGGVDSRDTAKAYTRKHIVGTAAYDSSTAVVTPGIWKKTGTCGSLTAPCFDPTTVTGWTDGGVYAVQVIVNFTGQYGFGRFLGFTSRNLVDTAVAVRGSVLSSPCTRPLAIPYQSLLDVLYPPAGTKDPSYELTDSDINRLRIMTTANNIPLKVGKAGDLTPNGEFYAVDLPPGQYANGDKGSPITGGSGYSNFLGWKCKQVSQAETDQDPLHPPGVSVGDYLQPESGEMTGPTKQGIDALCGSDTCTPPMKITAALWDVITDVTYCKACYHVKYLGAFAVTGYDNSSKTVTGYFTTMATSGELGSVPGPIQSVGLVK